LAKTFREHEHRRENEHNQPDSTQRQDRCETAHPKIAKAVTDRDFHLWNT